MTQDASSALMTAEDCPDDLAVGTRNEAKPFIPPQVDIDGFSAIALLETQTFSLPPKTIDFIVITNRHLADAVIHLLYHERSALTGAPGLARSTPRQDYL